MKRLIVLIGLVAWGSALPTQAAELSEAEGSAIRAVIADQLAAFRRDDAGAAFAFASPTIRQKFRTAETFMAMVREGYLPVYRPREVEFRDLVVVRGAPIQRVFLMGPDGLPVIALYEMQRQTSGVWKIDGCYLVRAAGEGA